jgi:hypothetical protein
MPARSSVFELYVRPGDVDPGSGTRFPTAIPEMIASSNGLNPGRNDPTTVATMPAAAASAMPGRRLGDGRSVAGLLPVARCASGSDATWGARERPDWPAASGRWPLPGAAELWEAGELMVTTLPRGGDAR